MSKVMRLLCIFSVLMALLAACAPAATPTAPPAAQVEPTKAPEVVAPPAGLPAKITVGVNSENPPWIFMKDGTMTGFEADIIEEFGKRKGIEIEYKSAPFATVLTGVQSGQWDVAMSSIWVKQERAEVMDFADPYYDAQIGLMVQKSKPIASFEEMKGKVFGSDTGSANESWLKEAVAKYGPYDIKSYDYWADAVLDLQAGRVDGVVVDAPIALYYIQEHPDTDLDMPLYIDDYHFAQSLAFQKGSPLLAVFNEVQNEMKMDGTMAAIHRKWFGTDPLPDSSSVNIIAPYLPNEKPEVGGVTKPVTPAVQLPAKVTVGVNSENPPWIFMKDGTMTGFEADIIEEFGKRMGIQIEYKSAPFATVLTGVQSGQWDIAMSSIWVKQERAEVMDFADPYYDAQIGLMVQKSKPIASFEEMKGKVFGSDTGSANESWLKEAVAKYGPYEIKSYDYWADAVLDLQAGRVDGVVVDAPIALYYIQEHPDTDLDMPLYIDDYHFAQSLAFQKGSPLLAVFNEVQNEMKKDGTMAAIHRKWFGTDPLPDSSSVNIIAPYLPNEKP